MKAEKKKESRSRDLGKRLADLTNGRDEMNLCELPFATLSERNGGRNTLHFQVEEYDPVLRQNAQRSLTVKGDPEFGLPTEKDEEIYLSLLKYSSDYNGFSDPEIRFSRSDLFDLMGWPRTDWAYARLTKGMHRLVGVRLSYQSLWRDNRDKQWRDQGAFGILDSFQFRDSRVVGQNASFTEQSSVFRWGAVLFESFDSGYLKRIDYGLVRNLSATARRLYRYLDKHFHPPQKTRITIDLAKLAYQHIGVSPGVELDKVRKRHIGPAAEELEAAGYLQPAKRDRITKLKRGVWQATFELPETASGSQSNNRSDTGETNRIVDALKRRKVTPAKALALAASNSSELIEQAIRAMDEQIGKGVTIRSPERWIEHALTKGFRASCALENAAVRPERRPFRRQRNAA